jgi:hypothetical protein
LQKYPQAGLKRVQLVLKAFTRDEEEQSISFHVIAGNNRFGQATTGKPQLRTQPWKERWVHKRSVRTSTS